DNSGPTLSSRNLAILHTAIYDAVQSILRTAQPYRFQVDPPAECSPEAAALEAGCTVLSSLYPGSRQRVLALRAAFLEQAPPGPALTHRLELARIIGELFLEHRSADGSQTDVPYIPSDLPGQWRRTPPFFRPPLTPNWRHVGTFGIDDVESFATRPPPPLDSPEYAEALNEVKALGGAGST